MSKRLLTGLKPTGELTLGNYIGAILPFIEMQKDFDDVFLFVADLHALTIHQNPKELKERIRKFAAMYLACGVNPEKTTIYIQSENEFISAISWVLECNTYFGEASRMIQFKEKSKGKDNFSVGLLTYPVLMAADILFCDADYVPVGEDQKRHVELARNIAERFNHLYGDTFKIPTPYITKRGTKIKDLKDPTKKMSKSEENPNGVISMYDDRETIIKKIKGATTDSESIIKFDEEKKPGISNLLNIASVMSGKSIGQLEKEFKGKNYGEFKTYVGELIANKLEEIQNKYKTIMENGELDRILDKGIEKAREIAKDKYAIIKDKIGTIR